jgi:hypothetical protein
MSRETRSAKLRLPLEVAEKEFRELLISSLQKCRDGSMGVFLTEAKAARLGDVYPRLVWPEARQLKSLAEEIKSLREQLGESTEGSLYAKYRQYCSRDGANDPGGARLAAGFLAEIERDEASVPFLKLDHK